MSSTEGDELVVDNAVTRELSHPKRTKYSVNIVFGSSSFDANASALESQHLQ